MISHPQNRSIRIEVAQEVLRLHFPYNDTLINAIKTLPQRRYNSSLKVWEIPNNENTIELLKEKVKSLAELILPSEESSSSPSIPKEFINHLVRKRYSENTIRNYTHHLTLFLKFCGNETPLSNASIVSYIDHLIQNVNASPSYQNMAVNAIRFYWVAVLGNQMPRLGVRPKREKVLPHVLSETEITTLLHSISNEKHRCIISLIYSAGLRLSEALNLRIKDIDTTRGVISIRQSK